MLIRTGGAKIKTIFVERGSITMTKEAKEKILKIIEKNSRLTNVDIAVMLDLDPTDVATALKQMEEDKVICTQMLDC